MNPFVPDPAALDAHKRQPIGRVVIHLDDDSLSRDQKAALKQQKLDARRKRNREYQAEKKAAMRAGRALGIEVQRDPVTGRYRRVG